MSQATHLNIVGTLLSYLSMEALTVLASYVCPLAGSLAYGLSARLAPPPPGARAALEHPGYAASLAPFRAVGLAPAG